MACKGFQQALAGVRAGDTWVKLSAPYRLGGVDAQRYVDELLDAGGPGQLVWASDWPFVSHEDEITYERCLEWLSEWIPDARTRNTVFVETPLICTARLYVVSVPSSVAGMLNVI